MQKREEGGKKEKKHPHWTILEILALLDCIALPIVLVLA